MRGTFCVDIARLIRLDISVDLAHDGSAKMGSPPAPRRSTGYAPDWKQSGASIFETRA